MNKNGTLKELKTDNSFELKGVIEINGHPLNAHFSPILDKPKPTYPDYEVYGSKDDSYSVKMGAAWLKKDVNLITGEEEIFLSVTIDHVSLPDKIYFNVFNVGNETWEARTRERQKAA